MKIIPTIRKLYSNIVYSIPLVIEIIDFYVLKTGGIRNQAFQSIIISQ